MLEIRPLIERALQPGHIRTKGNTEARFKVFVGIMNDFNNLFDEFVAGKDTLTKKELKEFYKKIFPGLNIKLCVIEPKPNDEFSAIQERLGDQITLKYRFDNKGKELFAQIKSDPTLLFKTQTYKKMFQIAKNPYVYNVSDKKKIENIKHETNHAIFYSIKAPESINSEFKRAYKYTEDKEIAQIAYMPQSIRRNNTFYDEKIYIQFPENFDTEVFRKELTEYFDKCKLTNYERILHLKRFEKRFEGEKYAYNMTNTHVCKSKEEAKKEVEFLEKRFEFSKKLTVLREERAKAVLKERENIKNRTEETPKPSFLATLKSFFNSFKVS